MNDDTMTPIARLAAWTADPEVHEFSTDDGENLLDLIQRIREERADTIERLTAENERNAGIAMAAMQRVAEDQKERDEAREREDEIAGLLTAQEEWAIDLEAKVDRLTKERDEARAALQWRPIETAPRDETQILWRNQDNVCVIRWPEYELCFYEGEWMPIPGSPDPANG